jgi:hypothetical protein
VLRFQRGDQIVVNVILEFVEERRLAAAERTRVRLALTRVPQPLTRYIVVDETVHTVITVLITLRVRLLHFGPLRRRLRALLVFVYARQHPRRGRHVELLEHVLHVAVFHVVERALPRRLLHHVGTREAGLQAQVPLHQLVEHFHVLRGDDLLSQFGVEVVLDGEVHLGLFEARLALVLDELALDVEDVVVVVATGVVQLLLLDLLVSGFALQSLHSVVDEDRATEARLGVFDLLQLVQADLEDFAALLFLPVLGGNHRWTILRRAVAGGVGARGAEDVVAVIGDGWRGLHRGGRGVFFTHCNQNDNQNHLAKTIRSHFLLHRGFKEQWILTNSLCRGRFCNSTKGKLTQVHTC